MNAWIAIVVALAVAMLLVYLWARFAMKNVTTVAASAPSPVIQADFSARKKAEVTRIDGEQGEDLLKDLNRPPGA